MQIFGDKKVKKKKKADGNSGNRDAGHMTACEKGRKGGISYPPCMADAKKRKCRAHGGERAEEKRAGRAYGGERTEQKRNEQT